MASVDIGNDQPDISYINSMDQTVDFLQIKRGNPHLDNTKLYVVGIAYKAQLNRLNFQILGVYQKIQNNISTDYYLENDKLVSSFRSDMDVEHWNAALDLSIASPTIYAPSSMPDTIIQSFPENTTLQTIV